MKRVFFLILTVVVIQACSNEVETSESKPIAKVFDKYLFADDVTGLTTSDMSEEDSTHIVSQYVDQWIKRQLLVKKAELNLTETQKNVEKELEDYRSSLLIDRYLQSFTTQKLDTNITNEEIEEFYKDHTDDFKLASNVVRAIYLQLPLDAPDIDDVYDLMKSDEKEDLVKLDDYCYSYAVKFKNYNHDWTSFAKIQLDLPFPIENPTDFLRRNKLIEEKDSLYHHIAYIKEHRIEGEQTPLNFVRDNIKKILITKRKSALIRELKNNIYKDALNQGYFEKISGRK